MVLATAILIVINVIPLLLVIILLVEVIAAVVRRPSLRESIGADTRDVTVAVLIPAHDEGCAVRAVINDVKAQLKAGDRILVVADNCSDDTATVARESGAEVVERHDPQRRGKGYALDFGLKHLGEAPPGLVIVIDADCRVAVRAVDELASASIRSGRPAQALNLMVAPATSATDHRIAVFTWRVKNWVRPLGLKALGLPCQLMGTGMALPWTLIRNAELASGHIVEDVKLGLDLARAGHAPLFCPSAMVTSEFPSTVTGAESQRRRWEGGHLALVGRSAVPLILTALTRRNRDLLALAFDMAVPPLTLLGLMSLATFLVSLLALVGGVPAMPFILSATSLTGFLLAVLLCWWTFGQDVLPSGAIGEISPFVLGKLRLYRSFLGGRTPSQWTRTDRRSSDQETAAGDSARSADTDR